MQAIVIDTFGGADQLHSAEIPVPAPTAGQMLVRLDAAGIGSWDPFEREGGYAAMTHATPTFPYVLGSEGAGTVVALGDDVGNIAIGDRVWATGFLDPSATFYAAATLVQRDLAARLPPHLDTVAAAGIGGAAITALRGLDALGAHPGETILIVGASGAIGHVALQIASALDCRTIAATSGEDGAQLAMRLGAHTVIDGHTTRWPDLEPDIDAALLFSGGELADSAATHLDRTAHPTGVPIDGASSTAFNGEPDRAITARAAAMIAGARINVTVARRHAPADIARAHAELEAHHVGKHILDSSQLRW